MSLPIVVPRVFFSPLFYFVFVSYAVLLMSVPFTFSFIAVNLHLSLLVFIFTYPLCCSSLLSTLFLSSKFSSPLLSITTFPLISSSVSRCLSFCFFPTQAVNQAGAGPYSEQVSFRTPATTPDQISSLTFLDLGASSESGLSPSTCLFLKWDEPNSNGAEITSYIITLDDQTITVESGTSHLVTGLQPDSEYRYSHTLTEHIHFGKSVIIDIDDEHKSYSSVTSCNIKSHRLIK